MARKSRPLRGEMRNEAIAKNELRRGARNALPFAHVVLLTPGFKGIATTRPREKLAPWIAEKR